MPAPIGPYDGRKARRKRCDGCVKRQIKCQGGIPCENCVRTNRSCKVPTKTASPSVVFVGQVSDSPTKKGDMPLQWAKATLQLHRSVKPKRADCYLPYFFASFLPLNTFISEKIPIVDDLLTLAKSSPALNDAIHAVAALHAKRQDIEISPKVGDTEALQSYARSVRHVQSEISAGSFLSDRSALWTTFILGLFELMRDSSGTNWLAHFLHGTSALLRLQRPEALILPDAQSVQRRSFFLATRILEISRALIFTAPTFLSRPEWTTALANFWVDQGAALWHPKEALFDALPLIAELSMRASNFCEHVQDLPLSERSVQAKSLGHEGIILRASLQQWWVNTTAWEKDVQYQMCGKAKSDTELLLGCVYYHAISIYLSGTYDYHPHWTCASAPILPRTTIDWHVCEILRLSNKLLTHGVAGFLLFFPLRVAGARAIEDTSRGTILDLLRTTATRGYVVADSFTVDLLQLWTGGELHSLPG